MVTRKRMLQKWFVVLFVLPPVLFVVYAVVQLFVIMPYQDKHGYTYASALSEHMAAMNAGDAEDAKHWAGRMLYYSSLSDEDPSKRGHGFGRLFGYRGYCGPKYQAESRRCLAVAHELGQEHEEALALYEDLDGCSLAEGRVYHKLGRKEEAFKAYCRWASASKDRVDLTPPVSRSARDVARIRNSILGSRGWDYEPTLSPFDSYTKFLYFMQQQWEETGNAEDYREAMEFLEAVR